jgi:hypothetical protein
MNGILKPKLTRSAKRIVKAMNYAYKGEAAKRRILEKEGFLARKHTQEIEEQQAIKRLKKQDEKRFWAAKEVCLQRGYTEEDWEMFASVLPNRDTIYKMQEESDI